MRTSSLRTRAIAMVTLATGLQLVAATMPASAQQRPMTSPRDSAPPDSIAAANTRDAEAVLARLGADADKPAGEVFENIKFLTDIPARGLVGIMNNGYARALGVRCTHCHVANDYASDDKRPKRAAREMMAMHRSINEQLAAMQNLQGPRTPTVNCSTCHRGNVRPGGGGGRPQGAAPEGRPQGPPPGTGRP